VRLGPFVLAYNLGNLLQRLALPKAIKGWSLRSVQVKLIKIGGRLVRHARRLVFQLAEAVSGRLRLSETSVVGSARADGRLCPRGICTTELCEVADAAPQAV
jgi:hypothetical protein